VVVEGVLVISVAAVNEPAALGARREQALF
jgi:hypothetical protein